MSGDARVERASSNDLADLVCDVTGSQDQDLDFLRGVSERAHSTIHLNSLVTIR